MGNRIAHQHVPQSRGRQPLDARGSKPLHYSTRSTKKYLQPPSDTINEYLQSRSQQYQTTQTDLDSPFEPLGYREAYEHLRELAEKRMRKNHKTTDAHANTAYGIVYPTCENSRTVNRPVKRTIPAGCGPPHQQDPCLCTTNGLGDNASRRAGDSCVSDSDDATIQIEEDNLTTKPPTVSRLTSSFDFIPQTGDVRSVSMTSTTSGEYYNPNVSGARKHRSACRNDDKLHQSATIARNLRTVGSPLPRLKQHDKTGITENSLATLSVGTKSGEPCRVRRSLSVCPSPFSTGTRFVTPQLGFQTEPNGIVSYTALLTAGPCGVPTDGWLNDIRKRAYRHLIGLNRQYRCQVHFDPAVIPYRGLYVHALVISGHSQSDLIRCRNALPSCIERYLITPYAHHGTMLRQAR
ncbi:unnamed protein product [Dicrocoelium dendriticum]|nr:unnamed protein product [Dicrocoelium dendriticum]